MPQTPRPAFSEQADHEPLWAEQREKQAHLLSEAALVARYWPVLPETLRQLVRDGIERVNSDANEKAFGLSADMVGMPDCGNYAIAVEQSKFFEKILNKRICALKGTSAP